MSGFAAEAIAVVGGSADRVDGSGMDYTAVITPAAEFQGLLAVSIGGRCRAGFRRQHELRL